MILQTLVGTKKIEIDQDEILKLIEKERKEELQKNNNFLELDIYE
jgi:hypothetical protein